MSNIELVLHSGEHLSTGRHTANAVAEARSTGADLEVHGPDDPFAEFGVAKERPPRTINGADIYTYAVLG